MKRQQVCETLTSKPEWHAGAFGILAPLSYSQLPLRDTAAGVYAPDSTRLRAQQLDAGHKSGRPNHSPKFAHAPMARQLQPLQSSYKQYTDGM